MLKQANSEVTTLAELTALKASGKPLNAASLILLSALTVDPNKASAVGDFTECNFGGYAAVAGLTFGTPFKDQDGKYKLVAANSNFIFTGTGGQNVVGYALTDVAKAIVYRVVKFDTVIVLSTANQGFDVLPEFCYGE